ncbi:MAG TPA: hypothetical protein VME20_09515, partial [Acidimicrobiales bacterium]|nr:hypothetical protein [Acidimicrobiales bacterium]
MRPVLEQGRLRPSRTAQQQYAYVILVGVRCRVLLCTAVLLAQLGQFNSVAEAGTAPPPMVPGRPRATGFNLTSVTASKIMAAWAKPKRAGFAATPTWRAQRSLALSTHLAQSALVGAGRQATTLSSGDAASTLRPCGAPMANNTTWTPGSVYVLSCAFTVGPHATLTIRAGTVVKFTAGAGLSVEGTLDSTGTAARPVVMTSVNNNSVGGATGSGKPAAGDWGGVVVGGA